MLYVFVWLLSENFFCWQIDFFDRDAHVICSGRLSVFNSFVFFREPMSDDFADCSAVCYGLNGVLIRHQIA